MALKNYLDLTGLGYFRDKILASSIIEDAYTVVPAGAKNVHLQYYTLSGTTYTPVAIADVPDTIPANTYYTINKGSKSDIQHAPSVKGMTDFTKTYVDYVIEEEVAPLIDAKVTSVSYGTTTISGSSFTGIYTTNGTTKAVVAVDSTDGGTYQSTDLVTSGAVNAGLASVNASIKNSTITLTQNDDTVIDSFTLNQSADKTIKLPELGKVDDVQVGGTSVVSNKIANIVPDTTSGGTASSASLITSGAVNSGIADVKSVTHTTAEWAGDYASLVLKAGQLGIESGDPTKVKIGDGVKTWTQLPYFTGTTGAVAQEYATTITSEIAPSGSTIYTIPGYTSTSYVEVFMNNLRAVKGVQYTVTNAGAVTSLMDLGVGTNVIITCYTPSATSIVPVSDVQVNGTTVVVGTVANITGVASLESPALTGTPTAPTATAGTSTTQIATTEFVMNAIQVAIQNAMAASY